MSKCAKEIEQELLKFNKAREQELLKLEQESLKREQELLKWEKEFDKMIQIMVKNGLEISLEDFEL